METEIKETKQICTINWIRIKSKWNCWKLQDKRERERINQLSKQKKQMKRHEEKLKHERKMKLKVAKMQMEQKNKQKSKIS